MSDEHADRADQPGRPSAASPTLPGQDDGGRSMARTAAGIVVLTGAAYLILRGINAILRRL